jgi:hypothetical protein
MAADAREKIIKATQDKIQTQNKDAEKSDDLRLLRIRRKDTQKGRSATKTQERCNLGYGKAKNPNFFFGL